MRIIINAEPDEAADVLALIMKHRHNFDRQPERRGWGWVWPIKSGKRFFIRQIKDGLSAAPTHAQPESAALSVLSGSEGEGRDGE